MLVTQHSLFVLIVVTAFALQIEKGKARPARPRAAILLRNFRQEFPNDERAKYRRSAQGSGWSYSGAHGPDSWDAIEGAKCGGSQQSPIDIQGSVVKHDPVLNKPFITTNFDVTTGVSWTLKNNGHTVRVDYGYAADSNAVKVSGGGLTGTYQVAQFHFHWGSDSSMGSEHSVDGKKFPMELHVVTWNTKYADINEAIGNEDGLAVLGFFFEIQAADNPRIATLVAEFGSITEPNTDTTNITPFALADFVSDMTDYYRYSGSLTTPTCNEVVTWTVFTRSMKLSETQISQFRKLKAADGTALLQDNYRPTQTLNSRQVKTSFILSSSSAIPSYSAIGFSPAAFLSCLFVSIFGHF